MRKFVRTPPIRSSRRSRRLATHVADSGPHELVAPLAPDEDSTRRKAGPRELRFGELVEAIRDRLDIVVECRSWSFRGLQPTHVSCPPSSANASPGMGSTRARHGTRSRRGDELTPHATSPHKRTW